MAADGKRSVTDAAADAMAKTVDQFVDAATLGKRPPCDGFLCRVRWQKNLAEPLHECPFQRDVNGKPDFLCSCCDACRRNCLDDV